jgi:two-component system catabolic regulation response regulator CreB
VTEADSAPVLVVEDDSMIRTFIGHALRTAGLTTVDMVRGEAAIAAVRTRDFAAAILDGLLPDMHGWALAKRLLDEPRGAQMPLLFVTGALRRPVAARAGVDAMMKPIGVRDLVAHVRDLTEWRSAGGSPLQDRRDAVDALESGFLIGP